MKVSESKALLFTRNPFEVEGEKLVWKVKSNGPPSSGSEKWVSPIHTTLAELEGGTHRTTALTQGSLPQYI